MDPTSVKLPFVSPPITQQDEPNDRFSNESAPENINRSFEIVIPILCHTPTAYSLSPPKIIIPILCFPDLPHPPLLKKCEIQAEQLCSPSTSSEKQKIDLQKKQTIKRIEKHEVQTIRSCSQQSFFEDQTIKFQKKQKSVKQERKISFSRYFGLHTNKNDTSTNKKSF